MSAPVKERPRAAGGGTAVLDAPTRTAIPAQRGARTGPRPSAADAAGRAYARRDERLRKLTGRPGKGEQRATAGRTQFVLLVMVLLGAGLVATLWLSTAAAADSYQLQHARDAAQKLTETSEQLHREVAAMDSAPALADRAAKLGMQPVTDAARLVVGTDGAVTVVGTPKAVTAPVVAAPAPVVGPPTALTTADGQAAADPAPADAAAGAATPAAGATPAATAAAPAVGSPPGAGTPANSARPTAGAAAATTPAPAAAVAHPAAAGTR